MDPPLRSGPGPGQCGRKLRRRTHVANPEDGMRVMSNEAFRVTSQSPASMRPDDAVLGRACLQQERMRRLSDSGGETSGAGIYGQGVMHTIANYVAGADPAAGVRIEQK